MHYSRTAFGIDDRETITPRGGQQIGQRDGLSPGDCQAIRFMYRNLEGAGVFSGVQFTATLAAGATGRWFTHSWPAQWYVWWTIVPTAPAVDGPAQIEWKVAVSRQSGGLLKYHLIVTNVASYSVSFEARYDGLSWSTSAT